MKLNRFVITSVAISLVAAPAVAQVSFGRSIAPVAGESELEGRSGLLAVFGAAAIVGAIVLIADDDDDAVSP